MAKPKETVYQRIVRAGLEGRGIRLSAHDCWALSCDDAIATAAGNDWADQGVEPPKFAYDMKGRTP